MPTVENTIVEAVLAIIRNRRATAQERAHQAPSDLPKSAGRTVKQREAQFSDFEIVADLKTRMGLSPDTIENWQRLWRDNPARKACYHPLPIGWVLESEGRVVGYLGSIPLLYRYAEKELIATTASGFAVEPDYRAWGPGLMASFYRQQYVDLFLNTTAMPAVGKIARALRAEPLPQKDYQSVLFWVLDPYRFSKAVMRKLDINSKLVAIGGVGGLVALTFDSLIRSRQPRLSRKNLLVNEIDLHDIGDEFEELWHRKKEEGPRLLANRTPEVLRWHFDVPGSKRKTCVLVCRSRGRLLGYAILRDQANPRNGLRTSSLADLLVQGDDPIIAQHLLLAAYEHAKKTKNHVFEVLGFPKYIRHICQEWGPYSRSYPASPFYFRAGDRTLHQALAMEEAWYACPFDGDTTLSL
jgi:hypothetical protein